MKKIFVIIILLLSIAITFYTCTKPHSSLVLQTHILIDENLFDSEVLDQRAVLDDVIQEAFDFFYDEFDIRFVIADQKYVEMPGHYQIGLSEIKPDRANIGILFKQGKGFDFGEAHLEKGVIIINYTLNQSSKAYSLLLLHELAHLFGTIDVNLENNIMNAASFLSIVDEDQENSVAMQIESADGYVFDDQTKQLIQLCKDYYFSKKNTYFFLNFDGEIQKQIVTIYENMLSHSKYPEMINYTLGDYYFQNQQFDTSQQYFSEAIHAMDSVTRYSERISEYKVSRDELLYNKALCLIHLDRYVDAIEPLSLIDDSSNYFDEKNQFLAISKFYIGRVSEAIQHLESSLAINENNSKAWYFLGTLYLQISTSTEWNSSSIMKAIYALKKTIEYDSQHESSYFSLGLIYEKQKELDMAVEHLQKAKELGVDIQDGIQMQDGSVFLSDETVTHFLQKQ